MGASGRSLRGRRVASLASAILAVSCGRSPNRPLTTHLVDIFRTDWIRDRSSTAAVSEGRVAFAFAHLPEGERFEAGPGVTGLRIKDGALGGLSTTPWPFVHLEGPPAASRSDMVQEVEIRLRVSAGANLMIGFSGRDQVDLKDPVLRAAGSFWAARTPLIPGDEMRTYTLTPRTGVPMDRVRHIVVRPTDAPGARFEIEELRVKSRKEYLASVPSGVSWQGLLEIYKETLVTRSPERIHLDLDLPDRPWLDLAVGTVEDEPVTFTILAGPPGQEVSRVVHTVTTPHRWEPLPVDLDDFGGRRVSLELALSGGRPGLLGFWGAPIVRSAGRRPDPAGVKDPPQGVVLVFVDTLRRDHLDVYGYARPTGPVVKRMASEGVLFKDAVSQATWTKVATPSVLTSLYPTSHSVRDFSDRLPSAAVTLADVFRRAGYATLSMSSGIFTGRFTNLHKGFEEVQENGSVRGEARLSKTARTYVDRLLPWLGAHRTVPFFVFLHVQDPHDPYRPYPPYDTLWADPAALPLHEKQAAKAQDAITDPAMHGFLMPSRTELERAGVPADEYVEYEKAFYDGSIRGMDPEVGRLLEGLRNLGLDQRTLVVYTADHGEEFLEHGRMFHGQSTYGELSNVPLVFWRPGTLPAGRVVDETVQSIDIMPTILKLSGLPIPKAAQGHSLVPYLVDSTGGPKAVAWPAITEKAPTREAGGPPPRDVASVALIDGGWKLVRNTPPTPGHPPFELYDHRRDPLDGADVARAHPEVVARLSKELDAWEKMATAARVPPDSVSREGLGADELERLRALGYIQ
jgi:arylsulfatase A-like enzyme